MDCLDGTDELNCESRDCQSTDFKCKSGRCIPMTWTCDGEPDCPGGEDEMQNCGKTVTCDANQFQCPNSKCIPKYWRCDYEDDCGDNSDEMNCKPRNCSESEFRCGDGKCIRGNLRCDGTVNCADRSDEMQCNSTCKADQLQCADMTCVPKAVRCDGDLDCSDGSDESGCTCGPTEFQCTNGRCIESRFRCDGWIDCADQSDELETVCGKFNCQKSAFRCNGTAQCVSDTKLCDGHNDCADGLDESTAVCETLHKCPPKKFQCQSDKRCISNVLRCDGYPNCLDGSDEDGCENKTGLCSFGVCSQACLAKPNPVFPISTYIRKDKSIPSHAVCICQKGYIVDPDDHRACLATGKEPLLLVAMGNELTYYEVRKRKLNMFMMSLPQYSKIIAIDVLRTKTDVYIFWIDAFNHLVHKLNVNTFANDDFIRLRRDTGDGIIVINGLGKPTSLALDWVTHKIYLIDSKVNMIFAADVEGKSVVSITSTGLYPRALTVHPPTQTIYWSTENAGHGIMAAGMDGTDKRVLVGHDVVHVSTIVVDDTSRRLYWTDSRKETIETAKLDGTDQIMLYDWTKMQSKAQGNSSETVRPLTLDVFEQYLYVALSNNTLVRLDKFGRVPFAKQISRHRHANAELLIDHPLKQNLNGKHN